MTIDRIVKVAGTPLTPGIYKLQIGKSDAVFTNARSNKSIKVPVKIETGNQSFRGTMLDYAKDPRGDNVLKGIEVGGSKQTVEFEN